MILSSNSTVVILDELRGAVVASKLAAFSALAATLAAVFAGIVLLRLAHDYVSGQGLTFWELVRPFVIFLLVARFNFFVAGPIHRVVNIFSAGIERQADKSLGAYSIKVGEFLKRSATQIGTQIGDAIPKKTPSESASGSNGGALDQLGNWFKDRASDVGKWALSGLTKLLERLGEALTDFIITVSNLCGFGLDRDSVSEQPFAMLLALLLTGALKLILFMQQCQCYVLLTILTLLGPFAFALSIFQSYRQTIGSWIARYISIALWIPIGQVVMFVSYLLLDKVAAMELAAGAKEPLITLCAIIVAIMSIRNVPSMASYVVESAGSGGAESGTSLSDAGSALKAAGAKALGRR